MAANGNTENDGVSTTLFVSLHLLCDCNNLNLGFNSGQRDKDRKHPLPQQKRTTLEKSAARLLTGVRFWGIFSDMKSCYFTGFFY